MSRDIFCTEDFSHSSLITFQMEMKNKEEDEDKSEDKYEDKFEDKSEDKYEDQTSCPYRTVLKTNSSTGHNSNTPLAAIAR